ncbi:hypothetical protein [Salipiger sp. PrR003]|uniref:hypothetical protein n=1 Tax=Salipiger sp. PrR003 TaxID=2706776 RepID=UPI0013DD77E0|nr:hypothetical protein [Salipiger sp. PrR003]NDV52790.1 hypothetical protein [Salipiger sp. PrR003]
MAEHLDNEAFDAELDPSMERDMAEPSSFDENDPDAPRKRKKKLGGRKKAASIAPVTKSASTAEEGHDLGAPKVVRNEDQADDTMPPPFELHHDQEPNELSVADETGETVEDSEAPDARSEAVDDDHETEYLTVEDLDADIALQATEAVLDEHDAPRGPKLTKRRRARRNASVEFNLPPSEVSQGMSFFQPANTAGKKVGMAPVAPDVASAENSVEVSPAPKAVRPKLRVLEAPQATEPQPSIPIPALSDIVEDVRPRQVTASRRVIQRAHMLAARIDTGALEPLPQSRPRKLDKFFSGRSRGYIVESPNRRSLPMVAVARRLGVAAITALAVVAGSLLVIDHTAGQAGQKISSMERLKTQLQDLADASLTGQELRQARATVEVEDLASVLPSKADRADMAPLASKRPQARLSAPDEPQHEVRPPLI